MKVDLVPLFYIILILITIAIIYSIMKFQNNDSVDKDEKSVYRILIGVGIVVVLLLLFVFLKATANAKSIKKK